MAKARGLTMGALLDLESRRLEREQLWARVEADCRRLQHEDPASWTDYLRELDEVEAGEFDSVAAAKWPEYNG